MTVAKALILFGSASDRKVMDAISSSLAHSRAFVCSAHRTPEFLERLLEREEYDVVIAGAGLAAHLPGVVASQTIKPVIGVPVSGNFDGLDALLAIAQMPPGVPVLSVGVDGAAQAVAFMQSLTYATTVTLVNEAGDGARKAVDACAATLSELGVTHAQSPVLAAGTVNIRFRAANAPLISAVHETPMTINVPILEGSHASDAQQFLELTRTGVWVGLNRGENAAIAAVQLLNLDGMHTAKLHKYRAGLRTKVYASNPKVPATYAGAGVSIDAGNDAVHRMREYVRSTFTPHVLADVGLFGGLFALGDVKDPVLVASTDGVGTKVKLAAMAGSMSTVGQDLVNHCANDILAQGAKPLFFLDYVAASKIDPATVASMVQGLAIACKRNGCSLIGGETAEMPGVYKPGHYDLAGTIIGIVARERIIDGSRVQEGNVLIGLASSGLHTNGYSLAMKVLLDDAGLALDATPAGLDGDGTLGNALLAVHKSYVHSVWPLLDAGIVHALAHITGGGLVENVPRVLPKGLAARIDTTSWKVPVLFQLIQERGDVSREEMFRTFNMGIGMVIAVSKEHELQAMQLLAKHGENPQVIGTIVRGHGVVLV